MTKELLPIRKKSFKKIPQKYSGFAMGAILVLLMAFMMSFVITMLNIGFIDDFSIKWMTAYITILPIAIPIAVFLTPLVKSFIDRISAWVSLSKLNRESLMRDDNYMGKIHHLFTSIHNDYPHSSNSAI